MKWVFRAKGRDDGVAIASVILLMIVVLGLSVIMLGLVVMQVKPTLVNAKSTRTVSAAQAGLEAAVSQIRNALSEDSSGSMMGDVHQLPCSVQGSVDSSDSATSFAVAIAYYRTDPSQQSSEWRADSHNQIPCRPDTPPYGLGSVPGYALLTSEGFDATATAMTGKVDRTVEAVYKFSLQTVNIVGGRIYSNGKAFCLVAGGTSQGSRIYYRTSSSSACNTPDETNTWVWDTDYMIHLSSTKNLGTDLCITGRATNSTSLPAMTLQPCGTDNDVDLGQRWSWRDGGSWEGQKSDNSDYGDFMMRASRDTSLDGAYLAASSPFNTSATEYRSFEPEPAVGAGGASKATNQVVSLLEFGRCLDVFRDKLYMPYSILYPCKQDPTGNERFRWNHKWVYQDPDEGTTTRTTTIVVTPTLEYTSSGGTRFGWYGAFLNKPFCFLAPTGPGVPNVMTGKQLPPTNPDGVDMRTYWFPRFTDSRIYNNQPETLPTGFGPDCANSRAQWIRTTESGDDYAWTFRPVGDPTKCLAVGPRHHGDQNLSSYYSGYGELWSTVIIEACDGSMAQKWNANPNNPGSPLRDFVEVRGGS